MTMSEDREFLAPFLLQAATVGVLTVGPITAALGQCLSCTQGCSTLTIYLLW